MHTVTVKIDVVNIGERKLDIWYYCSTGAESDTDSSIAATGPTGFLYDSANTLLTGEGGVYPHEITKSLARCIRLPMRWGGGRASTRNFRVEFPLFF